MRKGLDKLADAIVSSNENRRTALDDGGYRNGIFSGGMTGGAKWPFGLSSSGAIRTLNHSEARRNARAAYFETSQAKALVDRFADSVGDVGLKFESSPDETVLGISSEQAELWAQAVESRFHLWALSKKQHRSETMNWYQTHRFYALLQQRDNDIFTRLYYSPDPDLLNQLQFEIIDADQIRGNAWTSTSWGNTYAMGWNDGFHDGIDRDDRGRERAYRIWVKDQKANGQYRNVDVPAVGAKSGRVFMLHGFNPEYAGQGRGYSRLAHAIQDFEKLTDLKYAHIQKAINQSNIVLYTKPSKDEDAPQPFQNLMTMNGIGPAADAFGAVPSPPEGAEGVTTESLLPIVTFNDMPEVTFNRPGGTGVFNLTAGSDLKAFENTSPSDSYNAFVDAFVSHLSAASGMAIEVLLMKFGQNFSASRATLILFWRVCEMWRSEMAADYLNPIFEMWLAGEIASGRINAPGWSDPVMRAAWCRGTWIGSPIPNIDPVKTAMASEKNLQHGLTTHDREARSLNGSSAVSNMKKLKREYGDLPLSPYEILRAKGSDPAPGNGNKKVSK